MMNQKLTFFFILVLSIFFIFFTSFRSGKLHYFYNFIKDINNNSRSDDFRLTIQNCNKLYRETTDELSIIHPAITNQTVVIYKGKEFLVDDILYAYDVLFENSSRYARASWLGVQNQQDPSDAHLIQELIWQIKPDLIIDLGTNTGGSAMFFASIMNYYNKNGKILTIDAKSFDKNWYAGKSLCKTCVNPNNTFLWQNYVTFFKGFTTDDLTVKVVKEFVKNASKVFISVDASHEPIQVYNDMNTYSKYVTIGSYMVIQDTKLDRIWRQFKIPINAYIDKFLQENSNFVMDRDLELLYFYTQHPKGYLKRIS